MHRIMKCRAVQTFCSSINTEHAKDTSKENRVNIRHIKYERALCSAYNIMTLQRAVYPVI
jgi:hypothetical protein